MQEHELDDLFNAARADTPQVPQALVARVLRDAQTAAGPRPMVWRDWSAAIGGKRGLGGLVTATCVGFWIGISPPQGLPDLAGMVIGQDNVSTTEVDPSLLGWDMDEG